MMDVGEILQVEVITGLDPVAAVLAAYPRERVGLFTSWVAHDEGCPSIGHPGATLDGLKLCTCEIVRLVLKRLS
jgi:hypothetical protein